MHALDKAHLLQLGQVAADGGLAHIQLLGDLGHREVVMLPEAVHDLIETSLFQHMPIPVQI